MYMQATSMHYMISVQAHIRYDMSVGRETKDGGEWGLRGGMEVDCYNLKTF